MKVYQIKVIVEAALGIYIDDPQHVNIQAEPPFWALEASSEVRIHMVD